MFNEMHILADGAKYRCHFLTKIPLVASWNVNKILFKSKMIKENNNNKKHNTVCMTPFGLMQLGPENIDNLVLVCELCK